MSTPRHFAERRPAWAIDTGQGCLVSVRYFSPWKIPLNPALTGIQTAVFATRTEIRQQLARVRQSSPDARIVRVLVKYEVVG